MQFVEVKCHLLSHMQGTRFLLILAYSALGSGSNVNINQFHFSPFNLGRKLGVT